MSIPYTRSLSWVALTLLGLTALTACVTTPPADPAPSITALPAPAPTPLPAPVPSDFVNADEYLGGTPDGEKIPPALQAATEQLRIAAVQAILNDRWSRRDFEQAKVCFVAVGPRKNEFLDPSDALMSALTGAAMPLKKYSGCVADAQSVRDTASGARGILVQVCRICWVGPQSALVEYGYTTGGIHGRRITAEAECSGGVWTFTPRKESIY